MPSPTSTPPAPGKALPYLVLVAMLVVVGLAWVFASRTAHDRDENRLRVESVRAVEGLRFRLREQELLLRSSAGLFAADSRVTQADFRRFVSQLDLKNGFPGVRGIGYGAVLTPANAETRIREIRNDRKDPKWIPYPPGSRPLSVPTVYIEPGDPQHPSRSGFDMYTDADRRDAMDRACNEASTVLTARIVLRASQRHGFLLYYPIYEGGKVPPRELRSQRLRGFIYSPFWADALLSSIFTRALAGDLALKIYDGTSKNSPDLLFQTGRAFENGPENSIPVAIGGRFWTLRFHATEGFMRESSTPLIVWVPVVGSFVSLLVFALFALQSQRSELARREYLSATRRAAESRLIADVSATLGDETDLKVALPLVAARLTHRFADGVEIQNEDGALLAQSGSAEGSHLRFPLTAEGNALGLLTFWRKGSVFDEMDQRSADRIATRVAASTLARRLSDEVLQELEVRRRAEAAYADEKRVADTLARITPTLASELDRERLVQTVVNEATAVVGARFGAFFHGIGAGGSGELDLYALSGADHDEFATLQRPRMAQLFGPSFRGGVVRSLPADHDQGSHGDAPLPGLPKGHFPVASYLAVPVKDRRGAVTGVLLFGHEEPNVFGEREEKLALGIAAATGIALENANLFQQVRELNASLAKSVREREGDLDAFAYSMSHDLRTPLRAITAYSRMLEEDYGGNLPESAKGYVRKAIEAAARMDGLLSGLLLLERIGRAELRLESLDMTALAREASERYREADLAFEISDGLVATGDRELIGMVWDRLIANAHDFRRPDATGKIRIGQDEHGFFVQDEGVGFDPAFTPRLFQPFERLHIDQGLGGQGLGLAVARRIVERHNGTISAQGKDGKGATFRFALHAATSELA